MKKNKCLENLNLAENKLLENVENLKFISEVLLENKNLKFINLSKNKDSALRNTESVLHLFEALKNNYTIKEIDLTGNLLKYSEIVKKRKFADERIKY